MAALAGCWLSLFLAFFGFLIFMGAAIGSMESMGSANTAATTKVQKHSLLHIDLGTTITERATPADQFASLFGNEETVTPLNTLLAAIRYAATDKDIEGIYLGLNGCNCGMAQAQEITRALKEFANSDKLIVAYGQNITQGDYFLASMADELYVNPIGMVDIHGLETTVMFYKGLLDKLGIDVQVVKVGTFKSAVEPFILTSMSPANRLQTETFLNNIWRYMTKTMGTDRGLTAAEMNQIAESACYSQDLKWYEDHKLVDGGKYENEIIERLAELTVRGRNYDPNLVDFDSYVAARKIPPFPTKGKKRIAVLYAVGSIVDTGEEGIVGDKMVPEINNLIRNDDIDGLILRVNSGGGSAFASEQIWEALKRFKTETGKPFYVSMSDYAASGGYYISCGADKIFAENLTLTGSIGIFGLIPSIDGFLSDHLGITTETVATNPEGLFPGILKNMTPSQRNAMQRYVERGYELFTSRVAEGRGLSIDSVKAIAEGRVWDGKTALKIGLVDKLGGLDEALAEMTNELEAVQCGVEVFPKPEFNFWSQLNGVIPSLKAQIIKSELGDLYPLYEAGNSLKELSPVEARIPFTVDHR